MSLALTKKAPLLRQTTLSFAPPPKQPFHETRKVFLHWWSLRDVWEVIGCFGNLHDLLLWGGVCQNFRGWFRNPEYLHRWQRTCVYLVASPRDSRAFRVDIPRWLGHFTIDPRGPRHRHGTFEDLHPPKSLRNMYRHPLWYQGRPGWGCYRTPPGGKGNPPPPPALTQGREWRQAQTQVIYLPQWDPDPIHNQNPPSRMTGAWWISYPLQERERRIDVVARTNAPLHLCLPLAVPEDHDLPVIPSFGEWVARVSRILQYIHRVYWDRMTLEAKMVAGELLGNAVREWVRHPQFRLGAQSTLGSVGNPRWLSTNPGSNPHHPPLPCLPVCGPSPHHPDLWNPPTTIP